MFLTKHPIFNPIFKNGENILFWTVIRHWLVKFPEVSLTHTLKFKHELTRFYKEDEKYWKS